MNPYEFAQQRIAEAAASGATEVDLSELGLTALPPEIVQLQALQSLDLAGNELTALPAEIVQLQALQSLDLAHNQLTALPEKIGQLQALQSLDLAENRLTILPKEIGDLQKLQTLDISYNELTTLPKEIAHLRELQWMWPHGNPLTLGLPRQLLGDPLWGADAQAILDFYRALWQGEGRALGEARLLVVGQPNDGVSGTACLPKSTVGDVSLLTNRQRCPTA